MTALRILLAISVIIGIALAVLMYMRQPSADSAADIQGRMLRYLPLGDSYTIGESVAESERWPNQLTARLQQDGLAVQIVANPAVTGFATQDVIDQELPVFERSKPDFVTLQIGVNDYVQGIDTATFERNLRIIVERLQQGLPERRNILLVTIPDYGKTPSGARFGQPDSIAAGIKQRNVIISQVAADHNLPVADVFQLSQGVVQDTGLVAADGLHPSARQYSLWTDEIYKVIKESRMLDTYKGGIQ